MNLVIKRFAVYFFATLMSLSFVSMSAQALEPSMTKAGEKLTLNGEGKRSKFGVKVYTAGLYLKSKSSNAKAIIGAQEPMAIRLRITSGLVSGEKLSSSVREGFVKSTGSKTAFKKEVDQLLGFFAAGVEKGDVFDLVYVPGTGVKTYKNGKLGMTTKGHNFKKALFGIWLGAKPAQKSLKSKMLGK